MSVQVELEATWKLCFSASLGFQAIDPSEFFLFSFFLFYLWVIAYCVGAQFPKITGKSTFDLEQGSECGVHFHRPLVARIRALKVYTLKVYNIQ